MTLDEFIKNNEFKKIDFDKMYGAQCVDLFRQYQLDVLNVNEKTEPVVGAKDLFNKFEMFPKMKKYYKKVYTPQKGDIVIYNGTQTNKFGHVAIVIYATNKTLVVFEQDGFKQDGCKIVVRTYKYLLGFLRRI